MYSAKKRIIIVDNDPDILEVTKMILEKVGHHDVVTCKKKLLFRKISEKKPDLILFDYGLQDESQSMQICSKLKSKEETRNLPLIIFSTNTNIENICMAMGADDFIAKPFEAKELLIKIKNLTSFSGPSVVKCC